MAAVSSIENHTAGQRAKSTRNERASQSAAAGRRGDSVTVPVLREETVSRLFCGERECSKEEHAVEWLRDLKAQNRGMRKLPSAQRVRNGVKAKYKLTISKPVALKAIAQMRRRGGSRSEVASDGSPVPFDDRLPGSNGKGENADDEQILYSI
jgi:hypothetical protein